MSDELGDVSYHCLTCKSDNVDVFEAEDGYVHVYCRDDDCGWIHREVAPGVFNSAK